MKLSNMSLADTSLLWPKRGRH